MKRYFILLSAGSMAFTSCMLSESKRGMFNEEASHGKNIINALNNSMLSLEKFKNICKDLQQQLPQDADMRDELNNYIICTTTTNLTKKISSLRKLIEKNTYCVSEKDNSSKILSESSNPISTIQKLFYNNKKLEGISDIKNLRRRISIEETKEYEPNNIRSLSKLI